MDICTVGSFVVGFFVGGFVAVGCGVAVSCGVFVGCGCGAVDSVVFSAL